VREPPEPERAVCHASYEARRSQELVTSQQRLHREPVGADPEKEKPLQLLDLDYWAACRTQQRSVTAQGLEMALGAKPPVTPLPMALELRQ